MNRLLIIQATLQPVASIKVYNIYSETHLSENICCKHGTGYKNKYMYYNLIENYTATDFRIFLKNYI